MSSIALTQLLVLLSLLLWFTATIFSGHHHPVCHLFCRSGTTGSFPYFSTVVDPREIVSSCCTSCYQDGVSQLIHRAPGFGVQKPVSPTLHKTLWPCFTVVWCWKRRLLGQSGQLQEKLSAESGVACRGSALEEGYPSTKRPLASLESWATGRFIRWQLRRITSCNQACVIAFAVTKIRRL